MPDAKRMSIAAMQRDVLGPGDWKADTKRAIASSVKPRRIVLFTIAALLPASFDMADIADVIPVSVKVEGHEEYVLTDLIETRVQEARLVMT